jgi:hypothetical protein
MLTQELLDIKERKWNSEKFIVFSMVILQKSKVATKSGAINKRPIANQLDSWKNGKFDMLVQGGHSQDSHGAAQQDARRRNRRAERKNVLTEQEKEGIVLPDKTDVKNGDTVLEALQSKHPESRAPDVRCATLAPCFGGASAELRKAVAESAWWKANNNPPWAAHQALQGGQLMAAGKMPGVCPSGVREACERLESKCVLLVRGNEVKEASGVDLSCVGLEAGIEAGVNAAKLLW